MTTDCDCRCHESATPYRCFCGGAHSPDFPLPRRDPDRNHRGVEACRAALAARERATDGTATDAAETEKPQ